MLYYTEIEWKDNGDTCVVIFSEENDSYPDVEDDVFFYGLSKSSAKNEVGREGVNEWKIIKVFEEKT